jgi:hypothetical protein
MIIHLYAQCWNDEWMLPFFFRHYDPLVARYFIYDDGSTDATMALLQAHPKVEVERFPRSAPDSFVLSEQALSNQCWKRSRGKADWVIVTDIDEHLFHPRWCDYLPRCAAEGVTMVPALGFNMISEKRPRPGEDLCQHYTVGLPRLALMKASIFNPNAVVEINFEPGRHIANPKGTISVPRTDEMLLFHYKFMGFRQTFQRQQQLRTGLGSYDLQQGHGHHYSWSEEKMRAFWEDFAARAFDTTSLRDNPAPNYPILPWWEKYRK